MNDSNSIFYQRLRELQDKLYFITGSENVKNIKKLHSILSFLKGKIDYKKNEKETREYIIYISEIIDIIIFLKELHEVNKINYENDIHDSEKFKIIEKIVLYYENMYKKSCGAKDMFIAIGHELSHFIGHHHDMNRIRDDFLRFL